MDVHYRMRSMFLSEIFHNKVGKYFLGSLLFVILLTSILLVKSFTPFPDVSPAIFLIFSHSLNP